MLSIIIPSYNEELMLSKTVKVIAALLEQEKILYELVFVNDGSKDKTWQAIEHMQAQNSHVKGVNLSRNFGKEAAIFAGLAYSRGECCAVMDCDLQHPPETLVEMYRLWQQGYEIVEGIKVFRCKESAVRTFCAKCFNRMISYATKIDMSKASDFKLLDRRAVDVLLTMPEKHVFFRALSSWIGFKSTCVEFCVKERELGETKWSTWSLISYAIRNITSFSAMPMQFISLFGVLFFIFAVILGTQAIYLHAIGRAREGFTTVIILLLIVGSLLMVSLGIIGYYIEKIYEEIKGRPRYIVSGTVGIMKKERQKD